MHTHTHKRNIAYTYTYRDVFGKSSGEWGRYYNLVVSANGRFTILLSYEQHKNIDVNNVQYNG